MDEPLSPEDQRRLQITSAGMLAGTLIFLGISLYMHLTRRTGSGVRAVSYFALAVGLLSPGLVAMVDRAMAARPLDSTSKVKPAVQRHIVTYGLLEGAGLTCAIALFVAPDLLPLAAALVPVGTMVLRFPRAS